MVERLDDLLGNPAERISKGRAQEEQREEREHPREHLLIAFPGRFDCCALRLRPFLECRIVRIYPRGPRVWLEAELLLAHLAFAGPRLASTPCILALYAWVRILRVNGVNACVHLDAGDWRSGLRLLNREAGVVIETTAVRIHDCSGGLSRRWGQ